MTKSFNPRTHATEAKARQRTLAEAEVALAAARERADRAEETLEETEASLATIGHEDLSRARFELEQARAARVRADQAVTVARSSLLNVDTSLAEAVLPAIRAALPHGVEPTILPVHLEVPEEISEPVAVLSQLAPAQRDETTGELWSSRLHESYGPPVLRLAYLTRDRHRTVTPEAILSAAGRAGVALRSGSGGSDIEVHAEQISDDLTLTTYDLHVYSAYGPQPSLAAGAPLPAGALDQLAREVADAIALGDRPRATITAEKTKAKGEVRVELRAGNDRWTREAIRSQLERVLRGAAGRSLPYLGRIASVEITGGERGSVLGGQVVAYDVRLGDLAHGWITTAVLRTAA